MKPHRLEWTHWQGLLQVACATLEEGVCSQVVREFLRKGLLGRSEREFHKLVNGWQDKRSDWPAIAARDVSLLAADVVADAVVESVELAAEVARDTGRITKSSPLGGALSGYLGGLAFAYSSFGITSAHGMANYLCANLVACLAQGALRSPRVLTASHVSRLVAAFAKAADIRPPDAEVTVNFPFPEVVRQVALQSPAVLAHALPALEALNARIAEWPTIHWDQRRARAKLGALCAKIRGKSA